VIELAVAMPFLLLFAFGTLDFGRVFYTSVGLTNAVREGAHMAASLQLACDGTTLPGQVRDTVRAEQTGLFSSDVSMSRPPTSTDTNYLPGTIWFDTSTRNEFGRLESPAKWTQVNVSMGRDPTSTDTNYAPGTIWLNMSTKNEFRFESPAKWTLVTGHLSSDVSTNRDPTSADNRYLPGATWLNTSTRNRFRLDELPAKWAQVNVISCEPSSASPDRRTVTINSYAFRPITPFIADVFGNGTFIYLSTSATMPVMA
jgi:hypothetical protein